MQTSRIDVNDKITYGLTIFQSIHSIMNDDGELNYDDCKFRIKWLTNY